MSNLDKEAVEKLILAECNHNYIYKKESDIDNRPPRRDGKWTAKEVYEMFKDDTFWHVKYDEKYGHVKFRERLEKKTTKFDYRNGIYETIQYIVKNPFILGPNIRIYIYGGAARSMLLARALFKKSFYTFIWHLKTFPKDILKIIFNYSFRDIDIDLLFARDPINDIDLRIEYVKDVNIEFDDDDIKELVENLNSFLINNTCAPYSYTPNIKQCLLADKAIDWNCGPANETSYYGGDHRNYLIRFTAPDYVGEKVSRWRNGIKLDVTCNIKNDIDFDVNNFKIVYQNNRVKVLPRVESPHFSIIEAERNVLEKNFKLLKKIDEKDKNSKKSRKIRQRISNMEFYGWKCINK